MAKNLTFSYRFLTIPKRINHVELFEAQPLRMTGADATKKSFQVQWLFEKDDQDLKELVIQATALLKQVAAARGLDFKLFQPSKDKAGNVVPPQLQAGKDYHWPFQSGEVYVTRTQARMAKRGKEYDAWEDHCLGKVLLMTKALEANPPELFGPGKNEFVHYPYGPTRAMHRKDFYRGMYALGAVALIGYDSSDLSWGVTAFVNEVVATGEGERIGGGNIDASVYGVPKVTGVVSNFDPTAQISY